MPIIILKSLTFSILILSIIVLAFLWLLATNFTHPDRRTLQNYHYEWLTTPEQHGIKIMQKNCQLAATPCLFIEPDEKAGLAQRGKRVRQQLSQTGHLLKPYGQTQGVLVLLHGRNGRKEDLLPVAERFVAAGFKCVLPDLPAHGNNAKQVMRYATAENEKDFANNVLLDARTFFATHEKAGIWGMSLGGAYAVAAVATQPKQWQAMVIVSSFNELDGVVDDKINKFPLPIVVQDVIKRLFKQMVSYQTQLDIAQSNPAQWATDIAVPVLVVHGTKDEVITLQKGKQLFAAFNGQQKQWQVIPDATHKNVLITSFPLYKTMSQWYLRYLD